MLDIPKLILTLFIVFSPFSLKAADIQFSILNDDKKELDPGSTFNLIAKLVNHSSDNAVVEVQVTDTLSLIRPILDYSALTILKNVTSNRVLGFQIPSTCSAGEYLMNIEAFDKQNHQTIGKSKVKIVVKPRYEIQLIKLNSPPFLFAGDTVTLRSVIQNLSNSSVNVIATTVDGPNSKKQTVTIPKDSSLNINYFTTLSKKYADYTKEFVYTNAKIVDQIGTDKQVSYTFDVFPIKQAKFDRYNRFPIRFGSFVYFTNRWGKWRAVSMFDVIGAGTLGKKNDQKISFNLRGPDRRGDPLLGQEDSYTLRYTTKHIDLSIGDENFSLTGLTESSRNGRGAKASITFNRLTVGGFCNAPRYYPLVKNVTSFFTKYDFNTNNSIMLGALFKNDTTNNLYEVYSLSTNNMPFSWLRTDLEIAMGKNLYGIGKSYKGTFSIYKRGFSTYGNYLFADPRFPGYLSNSTRLDLGASCNLNRFSFNTSYSMNRTNLALDTLYSNMPYTENINLTLGYRLFKVNTLSIGGYMIEATDRSPSPLFDYTKYSGRLSLQSTIKYFSMGIQGDYNKLFNRMIDANTLANTYSGSVNFSYNSGSLLSGNGYVTYQGGEQGVTGFDLLYYGTSLIANLNNQHLISLQYNSNYEWQYYNSDRSLLNLSMQTQLNANNKLSLIASYNLKKNTLNTKELNVQLRYVYTLNVPVSTRKDVGSLTGRIINHGTDRVSGIRLKIDGNVVISDKEGNFRFSALPIGNRILVVDASSFGLNTIMETQGPYTIEINPATTSHIELAMTKSAHISGKLIIQEDSRANEKGYIPVRDEIERLVIEASNMNEVYRVYTDRYSNFSFSDLRPGDWKVKVYTNSLPRGYKIETTQFSFTLKPGEMHALEIFVKKVARQVKFQTTINKKL